MTTMEIALLVVGVIIFVISFLMPDIPEKKTKQELAAEKEEVKRLVEQEVDSMRLRVNEATNDSVEYAVDKAERSLERVSNEKIMAVNEYAGTILEEINKNHQEVMFLYDMLRDKQEDLTDTVRKADAAAKEMEVISINAQNVSRTIQNEMTATPEKEHVKEPVKESVWEPIKEPVKEPVWEPIKESVKEAVNEPIKESVPEKNQEPVKSKSGEQTKSLLQTRNLMQSKIEADLLGTVKEETKAKEPANEKEKVVYDILSGGAYKEGNIVNVEACANGALTSADFQAMGTGGVNVRYTNDSQDAQNSNDEILDLYRQGYDTVSIAKSLGLGVGEVKLVIDLYK